MPGELHQVYLSLGSNIRPDVNLQRAVDLLSQRSDLQAYSSAWESHAVGSEGPDFMNACVLIETSYLSQDLKKDIIEPIETALGRSRSEDKNAPRTIDIDILMIDDQPVEPENWMHPFVVVPLAEIAPDLPHPDSHERIAEVARRMLAQSWIRKRPGVLEPHSARRGPG